MWVSLKWAYLVLRWRYRLGNKPLLQMLEVTIIGTAVTQAVKASSSSKTALMLTRSASSGTGSKRTFRTLVVSVIVSIWATLKISIDWLNTTGFIEKNQWPQTLQIWTHRTIWGWKSTINSSQTRDDWWVESRLANRLGRATTKTHQQGGDKLSPNAWRPVCLPMVVTSIICSN